MSATSTPAAEQTMHPAVEPTPLELPVDEVILLEDRGHVIRRGTVEVGAGTTRFVVAGVAPVISDRTLCASLRRANGSDEEVHGARVLDLRLRRRVIARTQDRPEASQAIERERLALDGRRRGLEAQRARVQMELEALGETASAQLVELGVDASWGAIERERWRAELAEIRDDEAALRTTLLRLKHELADLLEELGRLGRRGVALADIREELGAELVVELLATRPGRYALQVDYIVPGACWRPYHRAEVCEEDGDGKSGPPSLDFVCEGCVWQRTGEDWRNVQLVFSTERPSLGSEPPSLSSDILRVGRRRDVVEVEVRDQEIQTAGLGGETRASTEVPGIDDGGEVLSLRALSRIDVLSDGQPHRTPLFSFKADATIERVLIGELDPAVLVRSRQTNRSAQPLLAGPVDLIRGGGLIGRTSILFIAGGERFELGWGPDSALRALREEELATEERSMLSSWTSVVHTVTLRLSNLGAEPRTVLVSERIPVSEIEKVKVDFDRRKTSGGRAPDDQGIVTWTVTLGPFARERLELRYTLRKHGDVVGL